jgi:hypothetical protein
VLAFVGPKVDPDTCYKFLDAKVNFCITRLCERDDAKHILAQIWLWKSSDPFTRRDESSRSQPLASSRSSLSWRVRLLCSETNLSEMHHIECRARISFSSKNTICICYPAKVLLGQAFTSFFYIKLYFENERLNWLKMQCTCFATWIKVVLEILVWAFSIPSS